MAVENQARATDLARAFIDALNARDAGALAQLADAFEIDSELLRGRGARATLHAGRASHPRRGR